MTTRWARVLRSQLIAVCATFTAAFSHGFADGSHPPLFAIALGLAFSGLASLGLLSMRLSRVGLGASIAVSQLLYHGLFTLFGTGSAAGEAIQAQHHGAITFSPVASTMDRAGADVGMLAAHALAAALTFAAVLHGERVAAAVAALAHLAVTAFLWLWAPTPLPTRVRFTQPTQARTAIAHRDLILSSFLRHRGPPVVARFA